MEFEWTDTQQLIAEILYDNYPEFDPQWVRYTDVYQWIYGLASFLAGLTDLGKYNEKILDAGHTTWLDGVEK